MTRQINPKKNREFPAGLQRRRRPSNNQRDSIEKSLETYDIIVSKLMFEILEDDPRASKGEINYRQWLCGCWWMLGSNVGSWEAKRHFAMCLLPFRVSDERAALCFGCTTFPSIFEEWTALEDIVFLCRAKGRHTRCNRFGFPKLRVPLVQHNHWLCVQVSFGPLRALCENWG